MHHHGNPFDLRRALAALLPPPRPLPTPAQRRSFNDYFVTHLPSSSQSPDRVSSSAPSTGTTPRKSANRDTTIVRIPLKSAKHHFGAHTSRGARPYNEDRFNAGTVEVPAFAKPSPLQLPSGKEIATAASSERSGDPQVFYFGVFDGHGGAECAEFLQERLHGYVEEAALLFGVESSLRKDGEEGGDDWGEDGGGVMGAQDAEDLQKSLVSSWRETVGGYFKRFRPEHFPAVTRRRSDPSSDDRTATSEAETKNNAMETVLTYAFLKADLDFTTAQASKHTATQSRTPRTSMDDPVLSDRPLNDNDMLFHPTRPASQNLRQPPKTPRPSSTPDLALPIGGPTRFSGGSTASIALISTPSATPFWHPASPSTLLVAHCGDTRILLSRTSDGLAVPVTTNHHPDSPVEERRLRRFASTFVTDSFGESRIDGLANTRAFGDIGSKRLGVSAEPEVTLHQLQPSEYAFMVLMSDGVSGHLSDQEIIDTVKESKTPEAGARELVGFAVEVAEEADNATALVVRLGGWEKRTDGGEGAKGTGKMRAWRMEEAMDPRRARQ